MSLEVAVIDSSVAVEALTRSKYTRLARDTLSELVDHAAILVPQGLFHAEALSGLRRAYLRGAASSLVGLVDALYKLPVRPVEVDRSLALLAAEVSMRTGCEARDAVYIALALALGARLYTLDSGQAAAAARVLGRERSVYLPSARGASR